MSSYSYQRSERNLLTIVMAVVASVISIGMTSYSNSGPLSSLDATLNYHVPGTDSWEKQLPISAN
ncbi:MAG: hypothetical protein U1E36_09425 [Rickettsiales bacterium]